MVSAPSRVVASPTQLGVSISTVRRRLDPDASLEVLAASHVADRRRRAWLAHRRETRGDLLSTLADELRAFVDGLTLAICRNGFSTTDAHQALASHLDRLDQRPHHLDRAG